MFRKNWIVADKKNFIGHNRQIIKRPAGVILNFLLVFLSQIGKKLVPLPLVIRCLLQGCF